MLRFPRNATWRIAYFISLKTINFHQESLTDFVRRPRSAYEAARKGPAQPLSQPASDAPVAFLSYASEDKALVGVLHSKLETSGSRSGRTKTICATATTGRTNLRM